LSLSIISCSATVLAQRQEAVASLKQYSLAFRFENALVSYAGYLGKLVWPAHLSIFYPLSERIPIAEVMLAAIVLLAITVLAWFWRKTDPCVLVGWLWFLGTLVPVIGIVQVGS